MRPASVFQLLPAEYLPRRHSEKLRLPELFRAGLTCVCRERRVPTKSHSLIICTALKSYKTVVADPSYRNDWKLRRYGADEAWKKFEALSAQAGFRCLR